MAALPAPLRTKAHFPRSEAGALLGAKGTTGFATDGLILTPNACYTFDGALPVFKFQSPDDVSFDCDEAAVNTGYVIPLYHYTTIHPDLDPDLALTLKPDEGIDFSRGGVAVYTAVAEKHEQYYSPVFVGRFRRMRFDKFRPNSVRTVDSQLAALRMPVSVQDIAVPQPAVDAPSAPGSVHPARAIPFDELYAYLTAHPEIERTVDRESSLEVFNCRAGDPRGIARGLVVHPPTRQVVATPFTVFHHLPTAPADRERGASVRYRGTVKMDGSMIVAYLWRGRLHTNTKRRHSSEQARWAGAWLRSAGATLREGHTYVLEAVYAGSRLVMAYPYDAPVLLAVFGPDGREVYDVGAKAAFAEDLRVPLVGHAVGTVPMFRRADAHKEGWVLEPLDPPPQAAGAGPHSSGPSPAPVAGVRLKLVTAAYRKAKSALGQLSPMHVWWHLGHGLDRPSVAARPVPVGDLPPAHQAEFRLMLAAMQASMEGIEKESGCKYEPPGKPNTPDTPDMPDTPDGSDSAAGFRFLPSADVRILTAYHRVRPTSATIPGYTVPEFLQNTCAKAWRVAGGQYALGPAVPNHVALHVLAFLTLAEKARGRLVASAWDVVIWEHFAMDFELQAAEPDDDDDDDDDDDGYDYYDGYGNDDYYDDACVMMCDDGDSGYSYGYY